MSAEPARHRVPSRQATCRGRQRRRKSHHVISTASAVRAGQNMLSGAHVAGRSIRQALVGAYCAGSRMARPA